MMIILVILTPSFLFSFHSYSLELLDSLIGFIQTSNMLVNGRIGNNNNHRPMGMMMNHHNLYPKQQQPSSSSSIGIINPYKDVQTITHSKFISHMGIAFIDLKSSKKYFMGQSNPILSGVSGQFNYGTLNAIIGPKYSGKTDLAKCLAGRNNINIDFGTQFYINEDIPPRVAYFHKTVETNLLLSLTVQESLEYTFRFRSIKSSSDLLRRSMMNDLIQMLQLKEIQHVELRNINP